MTSAKDSNDVFSGLDRDCGRLQDELYFNKNMKVKYHLKIMLKDVLGFAECQ